MCVTVAEKTQQTANKNKLQNAENTFFQMTTWALPFTNALQIRTHSENSESTFIKMMTLTLHFTNRLQIQKTHATSEMLQSQSQHNGSEPQHNGNVSGRLRGLKGDGISLKENH